MYFYTLWCLDLQICRSCHTQDSQVFARYLWISQHSTSLWIKAAKSPNVSTWNPYVTAFYLYSKDWWEYVRKYWKPNQSFSTSLNKTKDCDDDQLKGCIAQAYAEADSEHWNTTNLEALSVLCGFSRPASEASRDCDCNSQKAASFSGLAKRRSAVSHMDLRHSKRWCCPVCQAADRTVMSKTFFIIQELHIPRGEPQPSSSSGAALDSCLEYKSGNNYGLWRYKVWKVLSLYPEYLEECCACQRETTQHVRRTAWFLL